VELSEKASAWTRPVPEKPRWPPGADAAATATVGGGSNIASGNVGTGGTGLGFSIGNTNGDLISTTQNGGQTQANVNLGGAGLGSTPNDTLNPITDAIGDLLGGTTIGGLPGGGGGGAGGGVGGGGGGGGGSVAAAFNGLAPQDQKLLRARCSAVLASPRSFAAGVVTLCRVIGSL